MMMNLSLKQIQEEKPMEGRSMGGDIEREHMFDKVVTPSDVGKLNRLVIPKQHAERYFPFDTSSNEKGLLLNFEDRAGKSWRFRYSYWNSSQSYVMTKGWSRFVKDKKLDAGDTVSFQRGVGDIGKDRLYIDWRRRPKVPDPTSIAQFAGTMFPRFYGFPPPIAIPRNFENFPSSNHASYNLPYHHRHHHYQIPRELGYGYGDSMGCFVRSLERNPSVAVAAESLVIDSVPVVHGRAQPVMAAAGKRLRLFGVDMDCGSTYSTEEESSSSGGSMPRGAMGALSTSTMEAANDHFSKKGKSSLSLDLHR